MTRTTSSRNKVSIHIQSDDLHLLARFAGQQGVSLGKAAKILFRRGLWSMREGDPVLRAVDEFRKEIRAREFEQIGLMVESVIALRYLADQSRPGMSEKIRGFAKEAMANLKAKIELNESLR